MKKVLFLTIALIIPGIGTSSADDPEKPKGKWLQAGLNEISPSLSFTRDFGFSTFTPHLLYGNVVNDFVEPEIEFQFSIGSGNGASFNSENLLGGASVYYNMGQRVLPFAGLRFGVVSFSATGTDRSTSFVIAPKVGILIPITRNFAFKALFEYQHWAGGRPGISGSNHYSIPIGLSIFFE